MVAEWHKTSYSSRNNECVEVREHSADADVRDTQPRHGARLTFPSPEWNHFLAQVKHQVHRCPARSAPDTAQGPTRTQILTWWFRNACERRSGVSLTSTEARETRSGHRVFSRVGVGNPRNQRFLVRQLD
ncbi:DUF397 domain-containing protein [Nocardiopsis alba]|uniref:DUF397 domain-containing protein n=1 Tax=Nocardiopsis alba TaxID=53437 RepID=UPI003D74BAC8